MDYEKYVDSFIEKIGEIANTYGEATVELVVEAARLRAISDSLDAVIAFIVFAALARVSYLNTQKILKEVDSLTGDQEAVHLGLAISTGFLAAICGIVTLVLIDTIAILGMFYPEAYLAHEIVDAFLSKNNTVR